MIEHIGVDTEEIRRFKKEIKNKKFLEMLFSKQELEYCFSKKDPSASLTGKFCAKEAIIKALETPISMKNIEILNNKKGKIFIKIKGKINKKIKCSISHTKNEAIAVAVVEN